MWTYIDVESMHFYHELYDHYKAGFLLFPGAIIDQPQWYTEAMSIFSREQNKAEYERIKKQEEKYAK